MRGPTVEGAPDLKQALATIERLGGIVERQLAGPDGQIISVNLAETKLSDDDLPALSALTDLQALYLMETKITNAGLAHLMGLGNLRTLNLGLTGISGPGLK